MLALGWYVSCQREKIERDDTFNFLDGFKWKDAKELAVNPLKSGDAKLTFPLFLITFVGTQEFLIVEVRRLSTNHYLAILILK